MPDARMPERYLNDRRIMKLTAEEFRAYVLTTIWCVSNRTDGYVLTEDLDVMWWMNNVKSDTFVKRDLWATTAEGWHLLDFLSMQTSRAEFERLEDMRKAEREKKRRQRANAKGEATIHTPTFSSPGDIPGDVSGLVPGDGTGKAGRDNESDYAQVEAQDDWAAVSSDDAARSGHIGTTEPAPEIVCATGERPGWEREGNGWRRVRSA
jgi:hypothetical protein